MTDPEKEELLEWLRRERMARLDRTNDTTSNGVDLTYGRGRAKIKGTYVWAVLILLALVGAGWREFDRLDRNAAVGRDRLSAQHEGLQGISREIADSLRAIVCLQAIPESDRRAAVRFGDACGYLLGTPRGPR